MTNANVSLKFKSGNQIRRKDYVAQHRNDVFAEENLRHESSKRELITKDTDLSVPRKKPKVIITKQEDTIQFKNPVEAQAYNELTTQSSDRRFNAACTSAIKQAADTEILSSLQQSVQLGDDADYSQVAIEDFGMGMLLGMGWTKQRGIGRTNPQNTAIPSTSVRPQGLGLGANLDDKHNNSLVALGEKVKIISGPHKNSKGVVIDLDPNNVRLTVKTKSGRKINCSELAVEIYTDTSYSRKNKRDAPKNRYQKDEFAIPDLPVIEPKQVNFTAYEQHNVSWLINNIRIRIIDDTHPKFKEKLLVKSVLTPHLALLETGEELHQSQLETVIPRGAHARCAVVRGEHKGSIGHVNNRNKKTQIIVLDFWDNLSAHHVKSFTFDELSEYVD